MYSFIIQPALDKKLEKLSKRNRKQHDIIFKKVAEIVQNPRRYKNLRAPLQFLKRVHIDSHFVLTFSVNENTKIVTLEDYDHHDNVYRH